MYACVIAFHLTTRLQCHRPVNCIRPDQAYALDFTCTLGVFHRQKSVISNQSSRFNESEVRPASPHVAALWRARIKCHSKLAALPVRKIGLIVPVAALKSPKRQEQTTHIGTLKSASRHRTTKVIGEQLFSVRS